MVQSTLATIAARQSLGLVAESMVQSTLATIAAQQSLGLVAEPMVQSTPATIAARQSLGLVAESMVQSTPATIVARQSLGLVAESMVQITLATISARAHFQSLLWCLLILTPGDRTILRSWPMAVQPGALPLAARHESRAGGRIHGAERIPHHTAGCLAPRSM
jgi:hypothetical protein